MGEPKTDLMIKMNKDNTEFELNLLFLADDGFIYKANIRTFKHQFKANDLDTYMKDWFNWRKATPKELFEIRNRRKDMQKERKPGNF